MQTTGRQSRGFDTLICHSSQHPTECYIDYIRKTEADENELNIRGLPFLVDENRRHLKYPQLTLDHFLKLAAWINVCMPPLKWRDSWVLLTSLRTSRIRVGDDTETLRKWASDWTPSHSEMYEALPSLMKIQILASSQNAIIPRTMVTDYTATENLDSVRLTSAFEAVRKSMPSDWGYNAREPVMPDADTVNAQMNELMKVVTERTERGDNIRAVLDELAYVEGLPPFNVRTHPTQAAMRAEWVQRKVDGLTTESVRQQFGDWKNINGNANIPDANAMRLFKRLPTSARYKICLLLGADTVWMTTAIVHASHLLPTPVLARLQSMDAQMYSKNYLDGYIRMLSQLHTAAGYVCVPVDGTLHTHARLKDLPYSFGEMFLKAVQRRVNRMPNFGEMGSPYDQQLVAITKSKKCPGCFTSIFGMVDSMSAQAAHTCMEDDETTDDGNDFTK